MKYEIPYNFESSMVNNLKEFEKENNTEVVDFIYIPAFFKHCHTTREQDCPWIPATIDEYERHLNMLLESGYDVCILLQSECDTSSVDYYLNKGINIFTVFSDNIAEYIKNKNKDSIVIASITKQISFEELTNHKVSSCYDKIVLDFRYCRALNKIKELPTDYKYILLLDTFCMYNCPKDMCYSHWQEQGQSCVKLRQRKNSDSYNCIVHYSDLYLFEPYIDGWKIQGREIQPKNNILFKTMKNRFFTETDTTSRNIKYYNDANSFIF